MAETVLNRADAAVLRHPRTEHLDEAVIQIVLFDRRDDPVRLAGPRSGGRLFKGERPKTNAHIRSAHLPHRHAGPSDRPRLLVRPHDKHDVATGYRQIRRQQQSDRSAADDPNPHGRSSRCSKRTSSVVSILPQPIREAKRGISRSCGKSPVRPVSVIRCAPNCRFPPF